MAMDMNPGARKRFALLPARDRALSLLRHISTCVAILVLAMPECAIKAATPPRSSQLDIETVQQVKPGLSREDVYALLNKPRSPVAYCLAHNWIYDLSAKDADGHEHRCEYAVSFDEQGTVTGGRWKDTACESMLTSRLQKAVSGPIVSDHFEIREDALFAADGSTVNDIQASGRDELDRIAEQLKAGYARIDRISVIGRTVRSGTGMHDHVLPLTRAQAVRDYLLARSLSTIPVTMAGVGAAAPVPKGCRAGTASDARRCLQPGRSVTIDVVGVKRQVVGTGVPVTP